MRRPRLVSHLERQVRLPRQRRVAVPRRVVHRNLALRLLHVHDAERRDQERERVEPQTRFVRVGRLPDRRRACRALLSASAPIQPRTFVVPNPAGRPSACSCCISSSSTPNSSSSSSQPPRCIAALPCALPPPCAARRRL